MTTEDTENTEIKFDPNLDFQKQAIEFVAGVFEGQKICQTNFTVTPLQYSRQMEFPTMGNNLGIGNRLRLLPENIHKNIHFERSNDIKLYAKLPDWFKIDTLLGTYNPDWVVLIEVDGKNVEFAVTNAFEDFSGKYV